MSHEEQMELSPEMRPVTSVLKYLKIQLWKRGEYFPIQPQEVEATEICVLAQNEEEAFYYDRSLHMERDSSVWSEFPIPGHVEAGSVKLFLGKAVDEFVFCLQWEAY